MGKVAVYDSSTITLFVDIFKGAGSNTIDGKKKGGLNVLSLAPIGGFLPGLVHLTKATCNEKFFLGQIEVELWGINVFDKGHANYRIKSDWTDKGAFYVTRIISA